MPLIDRPVEGGHLNPVIIAGGDLEVGIDSISVNLPIDVESVAVPITVEASDSASVGAFGRWRISEPVGLFDSTLQYDDMPLFWETVTVAGGSATHLPNESAVRLRVLANGDSVVRQTRAYHRYQPGKSQYILMTFVAPPADDVTQRLGYFDAQNGIFFEIDDGNLFIVRRSFTTGAVVEERIAQANWNNDRLDGTGASGVTLDTALAQILVIDLEWLGTGRVRVGFVSSGIFIYAHEFDNANRLFTVYMTTANLPARYELTGNVGLAGFHDFKQICTSVNSEGGFETERGIPFSASNGTTTIAVNARRPVLSIRPRLTFNSVVNRSLVDPEGFTVYSQDQDAFWEIVYGGALTNDAFADVDSTFSTVQRDVAATAIAGGIVIASGYAVVNAGPGSNVSSGEKFATLLSKLPLALDIAGAHPTSPLTDILSVVVTSIPAVATDVSASFTWRELR